MNRRHFCQTVLGLGASLFFPWKNKDNPKIPKGEFGKKYGPGTQNIADFKTIHIPLVRRVYPPL
jgi:hypothetical protein